jgi:hypothetical protein
VTPLPPSLLPKLSPVGLEQHRQLLCSGPAQRRSEVWPIGPSAPAMRQRGRAL